MKDENEGQNEQVQESADDRFLRLNQNELLPRLESIHTNVESMIDIWQKEYGLSEEIIPATLLLGERFFRVMNQLVVEEIPTRPLQTMVMMQIFHYFIDGSLNAIQTACSTEKALNKLVAE